MESKSSRVGRGILCVIEERTVLGVCITQSFYLQAIANEFGWNKLKSNTPNSHPITSGAGAGESDIQLVKPEQQPKQCPWVNSLFLLALETTVCRINTKNPGPCFPLPLQPHSEWAIVYTAASVHLERILPYPYFFVSPVPSSCSQMLCLIRYSEYSALISQAGWVNESLPFQLPCQLSPLERGWSEADFKFSLVHHSL